MPKCREKPMLRATRKTVKSPITPGTYFLQGNEASADGAYIAGCRFFGGYPITPSSEVMRRMNDRFLEFGDGVFAQMEDEIASLSAVVGASWAGVKAMTATSGPGFSLMQETIGYAIMTETPIVIVNIQRAGPSTGQATRPAQSDLLQTRWGNHGGYPLIALSPSTAQEYLDMTVRAFNLAEAYRIPVILLADEVIGHAREKVIVAEQYEVWDRYYAPGEQPFDTDHESLVPSMPKFGDKEKLLVTGSTHDGAGLRRASDGAVHEHQVRRFTKKIEQARAELVHTQRFRIDDAELVMIAYGSSVRSATLVMDRLREQGIKAGLLKIDTIWPMADDAIRELDVPGKKLLVVEMNNGQYAREVQRLIRSAEVFSYMQEDGAAIKPDRLFDFAGGLK
jgi:2-oxoglutarate/2-oxoacid ferredoxin oxidoreductase subunit alpha